MLQQIIFWDEPTRQSKGARFVRGLPFYHLICFRLAVHAAVDLMLLIGELEDVVDLLLAGGDAAGILALEDVDELIGKEELALFDELTVLDDVHGRAGIDVADNVEVDGDLRVDLDYVLPALLLARGVFDYCDGAVEVAETEKVVKLHGVARGDVVDNDAVMYGINIHWYLLIFADYSVQLSVFSFQLSVNLSCFPQKL